jgi:hypothetical protein
MPMTYHRLGESQVSGIRGVAHTTGLAPEWGAIGPFNGYWRPEDDMRDLGAC